MPENSSEQSAAEHPASAWPSTLVLSFHHHHLATIKMSQGNPGLVGSVFERKPASSPSPGRNINININTSGTGSGKTGFPPVQHRSKSAFARGRDELRKLNGNGSNPEQGRLRDVPVVVSSSSSRTPEKEKTERTRTGPLIPIYEPRPLPLTLKRPAEPESNDWRRQISEENEQKVDSMTEEQREEERKEILDRFGAGIGDLLKKAREARERQMQMQNKAENKVELQGDEGGTIGTLDEVPISGEERVPSPPRRLSSPPPALSRNGTRPSSRTDRRLRFAELTPQDVYVYESAPSSPKNKKRVLALPPPPDVSDGDSKTTSLGEWKGKMVTPTTVLDEQSYEPEEGTPEDIRRRFFPNAPADDPTLAWMDPSSSSSSSSEPPTSSLRFDLSGTPIPPSLTSSLPTHLGLHHHADGAHAGYTLDDIFLLSRSSVPAQRATMLGILGRIARRLGKMKMKMRQSSDTEEAEAMSELVGKEEELRTRIVAAGVEAMSERGSLGVRAVEVIWECIVGWDMEVVADIEGVELKPETESSKAAISSLPLEFVLPQISIAFSSGALPSESLSQLLDILHRLARHSNEIASSIVTTPQLVANVIQTFLLTPIPPTESSLPPDPSALRLIATLSRSSRSNASSLLEPTDALLRFVTMLPIPSSTPYPIPLATSLLTSTLHIYTILASYGFYSHIATTAAAQFARVGTYVISEECKSRKLKRAWAGLLEAWIVCAIDPHRTTPDHEILWSQVISWGWGDDILELRERLSADDERDWEVWAAVWRTEAAWLEGAKINGVRGGEVEKLNAVQKLKDGFEDGKESAVVRGASVALQRGLQDIVKMDGLQTVEVSKRLRVVSVHANTLMSALRLWLACLPPLSNSPLNAPPFSLPFPQISDICAKLVSHPIWTYIHSGGAPQYAQAFCRPLASLLAAYLRLSRRLPGVSEDLWIAQAFSILGRLLPGDEEFALQVVDDVGSLLTADFMTSRGLDVPPIIWEKGGMSVVKPFLVNTLQPHDDIHVGPTCMSPNSIKDSTTQRLPSTSSVKFGLPVNRDWTLSPLDHLLRSGSSSVFKALPLSWDASEVEVARASLLLTRIARDILHRFSLTDFVLTREEAVFGCMKIFMLEHGQPQDDSSNEVFRDTIVGRFMDDLLAPYTAALAVVPSISQENLEKVAIPFLGASTPFYQYYTDFVALYDAISFSHPLFARLLLPPISMRYAADYRKHLWNDFAHVLKTIRTPFDQVISGDLREYLWPVEDDAQMIGLYIRSLVKSKLQGFVRLIALHHVACNIWSDLRDGGGSEERASKLLQAVVDQGDLVTVREIVRYHQPRHDLAILPPKCFEILDESVSSRMECIERWGGIALVQRLQGLLSKENVDLK